MLQRKPEVIIIVPLLLNVCIAAGTIRPFPVLIATLKYYMYIWGVLAQGRALIQSLGAFQVFKGRQAV